MDQLREQAGYSAYRPCFGGNDETACRTEKRTTEEDRRRLDSSGAMQAFARLCRERGGQQLSCHIIEGREFGFGGTLGSGGILRTQDNSEGLRKHHTILPECPPPYIPRLEPDTML